MNGIGVKYKELLNLRIDQAFYTNGTSKKFTITPDLDIDLTPSSETHALMKKLDFVFKHTPENGGLTVYAAVKNTNEEGDDLLRYKPGIGDKLSFWISLRNAAMVNFNQLPLSHDATKMFYFSNLMHHPEATRDELGLTAEVSGANEAMDTVKKQKATYSFHHPANILPGTAIIKHSITGRELEPSSSIQHISSTDLYFNLMSLPQGVCKLLINHVEVDSFYYIGTEAPNQFLGVVELVLTTGTDANYRIVESDKSIIAERPFFALRFKNRSTFWRYIIELNASSSLTKELEPMSPAAKTDFINRLNIKSNDVAITFKSELINNGKQIQIVSQNVIALREKYVSSSSPAAEPLVLTLRKYIGLPNQETVLRTDLQCPSTGMIDATQNPHIYSDILLTI